MTGKRWRYRIFPSILLMVVVFLITNTLSFAKKSRGRAKDSYVMTEAELQSELMSFADRFVSIITQGFEDFEAAAPKLEARHFILSDLVYSQSAMYTLAAEPNPQVAMLDMVVVTTLGRMVYENILRRRFGNETRLIIRGLKQLEADIWSIAAKVLTKGQQKELRGLITDWHKNHPDMVVYNYIRFSDFAADRRKSTLVMKEKTGGLFKSVQQATEQIEETRMLAERGIFLATRLPLLTGNFAEIWMSQMLVNPELKKILADVHDFSQVSQRMADVAEQIPNQVMKDISTLRWKTVNQIMNEINKWSDDTLDEVMEKVAVEREAFISQFMDRLVGERKNAIEGLMAEEPRVKGLVTELRQTLAEGNNLLLTANTLTDKFNGGKPSGEPKESKPFDIQDYRETAAEVTGTVRELQKLVDSTDRLIAGVDLEKLLPELIRTIDRVEKETEELGTHGFLLGVLTILIAMVGYVIARLIYDYLSKKLIESTAQ